MLGRFWRPLLLALLIGVAFGMAAGMAGPWLAALCSGLGGFMTTLAVQAGWWLREVFRMVLSAAPERSEDPEVAHC